MCASGVSYYISSSCLFLMSFLIPGSAEFSQDGLNLMNEIKIAEIVEMRCELAEENNFYCLLQEGEFR